MAAPRTQVATAADLRDVDRCEIIHGAIVHKASPSGEHSASQFAFGNVLGRRFQRNPGGRWPGGWWFGSEAEIEYETHEVYVHDVAGWRRDRVAERPDGKPIRIKPDWACELLSPSNTKRDRVDKFNVLHRNAVPHYWIVDPVEQTLIVHRWRPEGYLVVLTAAAGDTVRAEPFDAVELVVATLFGADDEE
ncbi:MAG: Uma2 family endonuclease [Deltaproteobacteria bacterium]